MGEGSGEGWRERVRRGKKMEIVKNALKMTSGSHIWHIQRLGGKLRVGVEEGGAVGGEGRLGGDVLSTPSFPPFLPQPLPSAGPHDKALLKLFPLLSC